MVDDGIVRHIGRCAAPALNYNRIYVVQIPKYLSPELLDLDNHFLSIFPTLSATTSNVSDSEADGTITCSLM